MMSFSQNCIVLEERIRKLAKACRRDPSSVRLMAVSKTQPPEKIEEALAGGQRLFGENRVQGAGAHWQAVRTRYPDLELHLIGPLQTNKAREAVGRFDVIETVDRPALVDALAHEMEKQQRNLPCFIQVNTGKEPQKSGVFPEDLKNLLRYCCSKNLRITGLMCIPPQDEPAAIHFALLQKLAARHSLPELSMGMSADFEKAIPLGATILRVGTALFGERA